MADRCCSLWGIPWQSCCGHKILPAEDGLGGQTKLIGQGRDEWDILVDSGLGTHSG